MSENTTPTNHTPGPWAAHPTKAQVDAFDGPGGAPLPVCQMLWPTELRGEAETFANAELIAAAPQMAARIAELEGQVEQARREERAKIEAALDAEASRLWNESKALRFTDRKRSEQLEMQGDEHSAASAIVSELTLNDSPDLESIHTAAAKAERAKCVAELREVADQIDNASERDQETANQVAEFGGAATMYRNAADHLEANGTKSAAEVPA